MPAIGILWGATRQAQTKIILSIAALNGLEVELREFEFSNKPAAFTSKFPLGKIPAFEGSDGFNLTESLSIARYVAGLGTKVNLLGSNAKEIALVDQWVHFAESEILSACSGLMGVLFGLTGPFSRESLDKHTEHLVRSLKHVEAHLVSRTTAYLVSDSVTLADLTLAGMVNFSARIALGTAEREQYPAIFAHYTKVISDEKFNQYWITEKFAEVPMTEPRTL